MEMVASGVALCVPGNHDMKLLRKLRGRDVQITHGLAESLAQLDNETPEFKQEVSKSLDDLVSHYVLDEAKLVIAHAGMKEEMQGRGSGKVRDFALYGETTGETDEFGLPVRYNWAAEYRGKAMVVYGHTPVPEPEWLNRTINIDTGCVFGGKLTALRYPEKELVSVPALQTYAKPVRPFLPVESAPVLRSQPSSSHDELLGYRRCDRQAHRNNSIASYRHHPGRECHHRLGSDEPLCLKPEMADLSAADDVAHRNEPKPGLSGTSRRGICLFPQRGVPRVVCEEKHMGSRAVVIVCRDEEAARKRFGTRSDESGSVTRALAVDSSTMPHWSRLC